MASRRRFGRVRQLPSRRWQARYLAGDGLLRTAPQTFARRSDAERWLTLVEADLTRGSFIDPSAGRVSVEEWSERWLLSSAAHLKVKTYAGYASLLRTKIIPRFGPLAVNAIKPIMVSEWVADMRRQGLSPSRIRQAYRVLSQLMRSAVENELVGVNPCRGVRLPRMPQTEPVIVSESEADVVIGAATQPHDLLLMLLAYGGLRIGEAFALRRRSFDTAAGTVTISQTVVEIQGRLSFDTPKSHQKRVVQLPAFVVARAVEHLGTIGRDLDTLLFATRTGGPQHYTGWRRSYFDPAVKAAGLTGVTPHDLRASHATWVAQRHGVMAAAARLGHAHASVTTRHYARSVSGQDKTVADDLADARSTRATLDAGAREGHDQERQV